MLLKLEEMLNVLEQQIHLLVIIDLHSTSQIKNTDKEESKIDENSFFNLLSDSNLKLRNDILKVSIIHLFIFSIIIIKNISSETKI